MNRYKNAIAMLLTVIMLLTMLPAAAFSQETQGGVMVYNCGKQEVTVDWSQWDSGELRDSGGTGDTFNADGSYTIQLEDDAFFPYEIQFQYDGKTTVETFDTPDSTVVVGGREIRVKSSGSGRALSQIGMYVDGKYVAAKPEPKRFTTAQGPSLRSLLPLQEIEVTVDLTSYTPEQLEAVEVSAIIAEINAGADLDIAAGQNVLWDFQTEPEETFRPIGSGTVDLTSYYSNPITMIVGTGNQLDKNNKRYIVKIKKSSIPYYHLELYAQDTGGTRTELTDKYLSTQNKVPLPAKYALDAEYYLNIWTSSSNSYDVKIYQGHFDTAEAAEASSANITTKIFRQTMGNPDAGYKANYSSPQMFTIVYKQGGTLVELKKFSVQVVPESGVGFLDALYLYQPGTSAQSMAGSCFYPQYDEMLNVYTYQVMLRSGHLPDNQYRAGFEFSYDGRTDNSAVTKAVLGHYDSLAAAAGQQDIKSALFPDDMSVAGAGYLACYQDGVDFTVFAGEQVFKCTVVAFENPGSGDTYLNITGAAGVDYQKVYKVISKDDSGAAQYGYQILLINDAAADLSSLKPVYAPVEGIKIFANGQEQTSGATPQNFTSGPVQYTARAGNNRDVKNYWVSFLKKASGPKLYVVCDGEKPGEREVFFDAYSDNHHDIFIANIGDAALTGLKVELQNPQHVKLDDYWKFGENGNDSLDPFNLPVDKYYDREQQNIAKVRLLPDGEGEVSGTLVISSTNGGSCTIMLKGHAGNPKIITSTLKDAVKYVPYSFLIQTDNKYEWNKVSFSLYEGDLPAGMIIRPSGEIYGVPTETGTFRFKVRAEYSASGFRDSVAEFTLTVRQNTDQNVAGEIDSGHAILDYVPRNISTIQDYTFRSEGEFGDFIDFWIDGDKLTDGVDYDAESGSTKITIRSQTFQKYGSGTHTIAAEFRQGRDTNKDLKRSAQNYSLNTGNSGGQTNNGGGSGSSGGGSGSSGGGSSGSGSGGLLNNGNSESNAAGGVQSNSAEGAQQAVRQENKGQLRLITRMKDMNLVDLSILKKLAYAAERGGMVPWLNMDSMLPRKNAVDVRVGINPALAENGMYLAGSTQNERAEKVKALFKKHFSNPIPIVLSLSQQDDFGQAAEIAVKVSENMDPQELNFYSYDTRTNTYRQIQTPSAWMDKNGYLHFTSSLAMDIVVSKGPLVKKERLWWSLSHLFS